MYLHPAHVDDALLRLFATEKRLCPYFDMPLQHIADPILKAMNRSPLSKGIRALIAKSANNTRCGTAQHLYPRVSRRDRSTFQGTRALC